MKSDINPFESQETKPYKNDPRISAMTDLVDAYQRDDIERYEKILQNNKDVLSDEFIAENIDEVTRNMRTKAVLKIVAPYTQFTLAFIGKRLKISITEVEDIIGFLIVDKKLNAKINQANGTVKVEYNADIDRTQSLQAWTSANRSLWKIVLAEGEGFKPDELSQSSASAPGLTPMYLPGMMNGGGTADKFGKPKGLLRRGVKQTLV